MAGSTNTKRDPGARPPKPRLPSLCEAGLCTLPSRGRPPALAGQVPTGHGVQMDSAPAVHNTGRPSSLSFVVWRHVGLHRAEPCTRCLNVTAARARAAGPAPPTSSLPLQHPKRPCSIYSVLPPLKTLGSGNQTLALAGLLILAGTWPTMRCPGLLGRWRDQREPRRLGRASPGLEDKSS